MSSKQVYCGLPHGDGVPHPPSVRCASLYLKERGQYIFELKHGLPFTSTGFLRGVVSSEGCGHPHKASVSGGIDAGASSDSHVDDEPASSDANDPSSYSNDPNTVLDQNDYELQERANKWACFKKRKR